MILLAITGAIGHGKTTLADFLCQCEPNCRHEESWKVVAQVVQQLNHQLSPDTIPDPADAEAIAKWLEVLNTILASPTVRLDFSALDMTSVDFQKLLVYLQTLHRQPALLRESTTVENKEHFRPMLQWVGGYLVDHVDRGIWYGQLLEQAERARAEGCQLFVCGGLRYPDEAELVHKHGGTIIKIIRPTAAITDKDDPTEREREAIGADITVINNGSLGHLRQVARQLFTDLRAKTTQPEYKAHTS